MSIKRVLQKELKRLELPDTPENRLVVMATQTMARPHLNFRHSLYLLKLFTREHYFMFSDRLGG